MLLDTDFGVPNLDLLTELGVLEQRHKIRNESHSRHGRITTYLNILLVELAVGVI